MNALFVPSYPQDILSVKAAISNVAEVKFGPDQSELVYKDGITFVVEEHELLYYLNIVKSSNEDGNSPCDDKVKLECDIRKWHEILGHCNVDDVIKLESVVSGMKITGKNR